MYETVKNLYYITLIAMLLQFAGLFQPFAVLFGIMLLYFAAAELFMTRDLDRLRRMSSISFQRRPDVSLAFLGMTIGFGAFYLAAGLNAVGFLGAFSFWLQLAGTLGFIYIIVHPYLPTGRNGRNRRLRAVR